MHPICFALTARGGRVTECPSTTPLLLTYALALDLLLYIRIHVPLLSVHLVYPSVSPTFLSLSSVLAALLGAFLQHICLSVILLA